MDGGLRCFHEVVFDGLLGEVELVGLERPPTSRPQDVRLSISKIVRIPISEGYESITEVLSDPSWDELEVRVGVTSREGEAHRWAHGQMLWTYQYPDSPVFSEGGLKFNTDYIDGPAFAWARQRFETLPLRPTIVVDFFYGIWAGVRLSAPVQFRHPEDPGWWTDMQKAFVSLSGANYSHVVERDDLPLPSAIVRERGTGEFRRQIRVQVAECHPERVYSRGEVEDALDVGLAGGREPLSPTAMRISKLTSRSQY